MPVRRAESLTTLRTQCHAPNRSADSRHQAYLVSDRSCPHGKPIYEFTTSCLAHGRCQAPVVARGRNEPHRHSGLTRLSKEVAGSPFRRRAGPGPAR